MRDIYCIRNVCILAHVDHGKTTIADSLLATNRLVSKRQAGQLRYLDDRLDEQERGITMKCSGISLLNIIPSDEEFHTILLNLIDTPGHIDFSAEVNAAIRVCDGAIIIVDMVEGVCAQTKKCMQQAYEERTKMILVLNKFDRLVTELNKTNEEIFEIILRTIEDCNAYVAQLFQYDWCANEDIEESGLLFNPVDGNVVFASGLDGWAFTLRDIAQMFIGLVKDQNVEELKKKLWDFDYYTDAKGNILKGAIQKKKPNLFIVLAIKTISYIYNTLVVRREKEKTSTILEKLNIGRTTRDMFHNDAKIQIRAIMQAWQPLSLTLLHQIYFIIPPPNELPQRKIEYLLDTDKHFENDFLFNCMTKNMIPAFKDVCDRSMTFCYVSKMFCVNKNNLSQNKPKVFIPERRSRPELNPVDNQAQSDLDRYLDECKVSDSDSDTYIVSECGSSSDEPSLIEASFESSTVVLDPQVESQATSTATTYTGASRDDIEEDKAKQDTLEQENVNPDKIIENHVTAINSQIAVIALTRVFTGKLKVGQTIYVFRSQYRPTEAAVIDPETFVNENPYIEKVVISELYMLYGRDLLLVDCVPAGNFCGVGGLRQSVIRTATLSTELNAVPFVSKIAMEPIVRNVIEPVNIRDMPILRNGLRLLMLSDPCVEVMIQETGELVLITAGDVHLAKCIEDLKSTFAKIEFHVSVPQISLQETVASARYEWSKSDDLVTRFFSLNTIVISLSDSLSEIIQKNHDILRIIEAHQNMSLHNLIPREGEEGAPVETENTGKLKTFLNERLSRACSKAIEELRAFSRQVGTNDPFLKGLYKKIWSISKTRDSVNLLINNTDYQKNIFIVPPPDARNIFANIIVNAFHSFCKSGPICEEPVAKCAFIIGEFQLLRKVNPEDVTPQVANQIETAVKSSFRKTFEHQPRRLMEPLYYTEIQVNTSILGKVYSVINKRSGKILDAVDMDVQEKTFLVKANIPVVESDGFANDIRKTTSGQALPSLSFSHFEVIDGDPYYVPKPGHSDEENEDITAHLRAVELRKEVRRRKGLPVEDQVVVHAEKQRTLNKKK